MSKRTVVTLTIEELAAIGAEAAPDESLETIMNWYEKHTDRKKMWLKWAREIAEEVESRNDGTTTSAEMQRTSEWKAQVRKKFNEFVDSLPEAPSVLAVPADHKPPRRKRKST